MSPTLLLHSCLVRPLLTIQPLLLLLRLLGRRNLLTPTRIVPCRIQPRNHRLPPSSSKPPPLLMTLPHLPKRLLRVRGTLVLKARNAPIVAVVVFEGVRFLAVDGVVADFAHFVRHAEGDAADVFDEHHDERGPDYVPADDEEGAHDLETDLAAVACDGAAGVGEAKGRAAFFRGPETWGEGRRVSDGGGVLRGREKETYRCRHRRLWRPRNACGRRLECRLLGA